MHSQSSHTACDIIEERVSPGAKHSDLYLGLLFAMEDIAVFGYMTNTKIKFIVVVSITESSIKDIEMKNLFRRIHNAYINLVANPFWDPDSANPIKSRLFTAMITELAARSGPNASLATAAPISASSAFVH
ncbi:Trafficking protein particle complex subunit 2-like protein [Phlyctochytrium planicorne]|nr:Trafficking protein particle complex subunit 2-like protein [Phlyctochytrium planicorne]